MYTYMCVRVPKIFNKYYDKPFQKFKYRSRDLINTSGPVDQTDQHNDTFRAQHENESAQHF